MGLRVLVDVAALLLEQFSREGVGGLRGLSLVASSGSERINSAQFSRNSDTRDVSRTP